MTTNHPGFPYKGKLESYINGFPMLILASQNSLHKPFGCFNQKGSSPNWSAITGQINHDQYPSVLACGAVRSLLMQKMLTVNGKNIGRNSNTLFRRILSRRHYWGHYPNHAEDLFESGSQMYNQKNYSTAFQMLAQAALLQHGLSHAYVSNMLLGGRTNVPVNYVLAYEFALAGAKLGCQHSKGQLAHCIILYGGEPTKSYAEKKVLEKKVLEKKVFEMAKESAMTGSMFGLSAMACCCSEFGFAFTRDQNEALQLYEQAAKKGHDIAQYEMGFNHSGNDVEAIKWFKLAAEQGHLDGMYWVGKMDRNQRIRLWEIAAEAGHMEAQHNLGRLLLRGRFIAQDYEKAERLLRLAAKQGYSLAQYELGNMFRDGLGVVRDYIEAVRFFQDAAARGHDSAQYRLGNMFRDGLGVVRDYTEAVRLYNLAAAKGHGGAQCALLNLQNL